MAALYSCSDDDNDIINENFPVLTTTEVTDITQNMATSGGNITDDGGATVTARGVIWSTSADLNVNNNDGITIDGAGAGSFTSNIADLEPGTQYYLRAYATNSNGTGYGNALAFTTLYEGTVMDIDGNVYRTVIIGSQEWMAENLRATNYNNGDAIHTDLNGDEWYYITEGAYAVFDHNLPSAEGINSPEEMVAAYGKLYNWYVVDDPRGLCPEGWIVPSDYDWTQLENYVVAQGFPNSSVANGAGNALKSCREIGSPFEGCDTSEHPRWRSFGTQYGFDEFGFSALPGGWRGGDGTYGSIGISGNWWSATEGGGANARLRRLHDSSGDVYQGGNKKRIGYSIRCIRDTD